MIRHYITFPFKKIEETLFSSSGYLTGSRLIRSDILRGGGGGGGLIELLGSLSKSLVTFKNFSFLKNEIFLVMVCDG